MYTDALEMMEKEALDVVDICLPTILHAEFCIMAMKYMKNINGYNGAFSLEISHPEPCALKKEWSE